MNGWMIRFALRIAFYGGTLYLVLRSTATEFDVTEWNALLYFVALMVFFEGALAVVSGNWPKKRRRAGRASWTSTVAALALLLTCNALRPRVSEVSVTYTGTVSFTKLAALTEIVRWQ